MAEEAPKTTTTQEEEKVHVEEEVAVTTNAEKTEKDPGEEEKPSPEKKKPDGGDENIPESGSFKEESTKVSDLADTEKKSLQELKQLVQQALNNHEFSAPLNNQPKEEDKGEKKKEQVAADVAPPTELTEKEEKKEEVPVDVAPPTELTGKEEEKKEEVAADVAPPIEPTGKEEEEKEEVAADVALPVEPTKEEEEKKEEVAADVAPPAEPTESTKEEEKEAEVVEQKVTASSTTTDEDGAKTVEAIEESVVSVTVSSSVEGEHKVEKEKEEEASSPEEVSIWGVPLLADERSDVILLKFLRARDFKVKEAFAMIKNTIRWRKEFGIEELMKESFGDELEKAVYMHGFDKEGHPVCYNIYGEFRNKELYKKTFSDEEKRDKFLKWRIQFLEKSIRKLDFTPGGISTIVQVNDLKNSPGPGKWELRQATKQALHLLQDNYPEFVAKQVFINVPWWYLAVNRMISPVLTLRTKSKFVFAGPSKSAETLLRYIAAEQLPVKYGGLSKDGEFGISDAVTEITVRPAAKHTVEFPVTEDCLLSWELRVIGWDISYGAEFVPSSEGSYTVIIQKARKIASSEEPVLCNNYKIGEPGKVVLTIDNQSSKKKKLLYRLKVKPSSSD